MQTEHTPFQHVLVVLNYGQEITVPLARASQLCKLFSAKMSVFFSYNHAMFSSKSNDLPDDLGRMIKGQREAILAVLEEAGDHVAVEELVFSWKHKPSIAVAALIDSTSIDLILKAPHQQKDFRKLFRSGFDRYFVSECPLPLWMVKPRAWDDDIEVLACVNMNGEDFDKHKLNREILSVSDKLSRGMDAAMHVVDCYYGDVGSLRIDYDSRRGFKREASIKEKHIEKLKLYISEYALAEDNLHFEEGIPDDSVPNKAAALNAEVAVIGNNEDNYMDRLLGDTAVALTEAMPCDILVIKPS
jgi:universal stress protein E